jgi:hypothetical protein
VTRPTITLLTDFGARDPSAGILHGVIAALAPEARIIDISHEVRKFAIRDGALLLWCALPYMPIGFHVGVVDPGVGTARRPIAVAARRGDVLIGPDNGLLMAAADRLGGIDAGWVLESLEYRLPDVSSSFHGRDIFAPAAAHLANGVEPGSLGPALDPVSLVKSPIADPIVEHGLLRSSSIYVDTFGNVKLTGMRQDLEAALGPLNSGDPLQLGLEATDGASSNSLAVSWRSTFGEVPPGELLLYEDSYGRLCLARNMGNAAQSLALVEDRPMTIRRA